MIRTERYRDELFAMQCPSVGPRAFLPQLWLSRSDKLTHNAIYQ